MIPCTPPVDSLDVKLCNCLIHAYGYIFTKNETKASTTRRSYPDPSALPKLNMRNLTEKEPNFKSEVNSRCSTRASGFVMNSTLFDGTGWVTNKALHSDMIRTEYRNRFNKEVPFHKIGSPLSVAKLKRKEAVYDKL